jgi:hypothetical protein
VSGGRIEEPRAAGSTDPEWHTLGPYGTFGETFRILTPDARLAGLVSELYGAMTVRGGDVGRLGSTVDYRIVPVDGDEEGWVTRGSETIGRSLRPASVLRHLVWAINQQVINGSTDRLLLHAAAADLDGTGVLIPAKMESGKTTLVTGLLDRGLGYLTDEAASVTPGLVLEGYPKPLTVDEGSWATLAHHRPRVHEDLEPYFDSQWHVPAQRIGPVVRRSRLGLVVFRRYEPDTPLRFDRLTPADALEPAIASTFVTDRTYLAVSRLRALVAVLEQVPAYELVGGELDEACDTVIGALREIAVAST